MAVTIEALFHSRICTIEGVSWASISSPLGSWEHA